MKYHTFFFKLGKMLQNLSSAAVVLGLQGLMKIVHNFRTLTVDLCIIWHASVSFLTDVSTRSGESVSLLL